MTETERVVYVQEIDPDHREEYIEAHDFVPSGVTEAMERGGVEEFELYVRDTTAVCIMEVEDLDDYLQTVGDDPAVEEWERRVAAFKTDGVDVDADRDEQLPLMERIWSFAPDGS